MSYAASALPEPFDRQPFRTSDGLAQGMTYGQMRRHGLDRPYWGVRSATPVRHDDILARCVALATVMDQRHVFGHVTALRLLGVDVPDRLRERTDVHVLALVPSARIRRRGVRSFVREGTTNLVEVHGLRVTDPVTTYRHVAVDLDLESLVELGDAMTRRTAPRTSLAALVAELDGATGPGIARASRAADLVVPGTDSVPETRTRRLLQRHGFPPPEVNVVVRDSEGRYLARPDLAYIEQRIAIEYDGDYHRTDRRAWRVDIERRQRLEQAGWRILTLTADTLRSPEAFLSRLRALLAAA